MRFAVSVITPPGYVHSQAFSELAESLHHALLALGHDSVLSTRTDNRRRRHIVFGANLLVKRPQPLHEDSILYNLEQLGPDSPWDTPAYRELLSRYRVWDYAQSNIRRLAENGIAAEHLPVGWMPQLKRIPERGRDLDVLFYGVVNQRRADVLDALVARGLRLHVLTDVYGRERDAWIARSRVVLNLHHYPANLFEVVRVSYLLGNGVCVLSERGDDAELEQPYQGAVAFADYADLPDACLALVRDPTRQAQLRQSAVEAMARLDLRNLLQQRLEAL
jgi:hypothetical protein